MKPQKKSSRRKFLAAAGAVGAVGLAGCQGGETDTSTEESGSESESRTIKQGYLLPMTGDLGSLGTVMYAAGMMATEQVQNADIDINVETQLEDTATKIPDAITGANALVNGDYPMMVGGATSNIEIGNSAFIPGGMVACSPSNTLPTLSTFDDDNLFFRTTPGDQYQGFAMAQAAANQLDGIETAATTYINDDYGQLLSQWFTDHFEQGFGGTVQEEIVHDPTQPSYSSKLQTALAGDPDLLVVITYPATGVQLYRDYYSEYDSDRPIMATDGTKDPTLPGRVGQSMDNVLGTMPAAAGPNFDSFREAFQQRGNAASAFTAQTYDASAILMLANAAAGENTGSEVSAQMANVANPGGAVISIDNLAEGVEMAANGEEIQYEGAASAVDFDENGDLLAGSYEIWEYTDANDSGFNRLNLVNVTEEQALEPGA